MSEKFSIARKAGFGTAYAASAAESLIGTMTRVEIPSGEVEGLICDAAVNEDGSELEITVEVPDGTLPKQPLSGFSLG